MGIFSCLIHKVVGSKVETGLSLKEGHRGHCHSYQKNSGSQKPNQHIDYLHIGIQGFCTVFTHHHKAELYGRHARFDSAFGGQLGRCLEEREQLSWGEK